MKDFISIFPHNFSVFILSCLVFCNWLHLPLYMILYFPQYMCFLVSLFSFFLHKIPYSKQSCCFSILILLFTPSYFIVVIQHWFSMQISLLSYTRIWCFDKIYFYSIINGFFFQYLNLFFLSFLFQRLQISVFYFYFILFPFKTTLRLY